MIECNNSRTTGRDTVYIRFVGFMMALGVPINQIGTQETSHTQECTRCLINGKVSGRCLVRDLDLSGERVPIELRRRCKSEQLGVQFE